jgi:hypothetical protein
VTSLVEYDRITDARAHLREIYDAAAGHVPAVVRREADPAVAVVRLDDLVHALQALCPLDPQTRFAAGGRVSIWLDGLPVSGEGATLDDAESDLIGALRDYATTWVDDLRRYPHHEQEWAVVNLVLLSGDDGLRAHLFGNP